MAKTHRVTGLVLLLKDSVMWADGREDKHTDRRYVESLDAEINTEEGQGAAMNDSVDHSHSVEEREYLSCLMPTIAAKMQVLTLTDFISLQSHLHRTIRTTGVRMAKGACLCGKVKYEFKGEPVKTVLCHCLNCRRITGTAFSTNVTVPSSSFKVWGDPKSFTFDSGQGPIFRISFCGECSSTLWRESEAHGFDGHHLIQAGSLGKELDLYEPQGEISIAERSKWLRRISNAKQFEGTDGGLEGS